MKKGTVDIHADDYGYTFNTSKDMLDLMKKGLLNSISIIPNTSFFQESIDLLYKEIPNLPFLPLISVHLNFVEGFNLSKTDLLSNNGINNITWEKLLLLSLGFQRTELKKQLKEEIKYQVEIVNEIISNCIEIARVNDVPVSQKGLRIDSHTHTHAIPLVFNALKEVIDEEGLNIEYIRNPKEPIKPFIKNFNLNFKLINFVKNIILNIFSYNIDRYCDKRNLPKEYMWGLVMSGEMNFERINILYPELLNISEIKNKKLEILFHPGLGLKDEYQNELNKNYYVDFNSSTNRCVEKESVIKINSIVSED